jgi:hypothetical protein
LHSITAKNRIDVKFSLERDWVTRFFDSRFFIFHSTAPAYLITATSIFSKIFAAQGAPPVSMTTTAKLTIAVVDSGGKCTSGVNDTGGHIFSEIYFDRGVSGGKFPTGVNDAGG